MRHLCYWTSTSIVTPGWATSHHRLQPLLSILLCTHRMLCYVLGAAKAVGRLWSSKTTFLALPKESTQRLCKSQAIFPCHKGAKAAHKLFFPLWVTFKSYFLSRLSIWMTRYSVRCLKGKEVIKRNSANLFSFLSLLDNLFIWSHFTSCRQTYFPMDRPNPSSKVHTCTRPSFSTAFQIHIVMSLY